MNFFHCFYWNFFPADRQSEPMHVVDCTFFNLRTPPKTDLTMVDVRRSAKCPYLTAAPVRSPPGEMRSRVPIQTHVISRTCSYLAPLRVQGDG